MALSGTFGKNVDNGGAVWRLQIDWTATQNLTAATSAVTARMYWMSTDSNGAISASASKACGMNYNSGSWTTSTATPALSANQKKLIQTITFTITHNASTGAATFKLDGYFNINISLTGTTVASVALTETTFTLDTIPVDGKAWVLISGTWRKGTVYVNVSGSWKKAKKVFVNVSGTWKEDKG